jgi:hypothetical protein
MDAEILAALSRIEALLEILLPEPSPDDKPLFDILLPLVFAAFGERTFNVRDLDEFADEIAGQEALREALDAIGEPRSVGRLLVRCKNCSVGDLLLRFVASDDGEGIIWRVKTRSQESSRDLRCRRIT